MIICIRRIRSWLDGVMERTREAETGATATEYSLLVGFIALAIVIGVGAFGTALNLHYGELGTGLKTALGIP